MKDIPVYSQTNILTDELCQKYITLIQPEPQKSTQCQNPFVKINAEIMVLLEPHIKNYFTMMMEKEFIYFQQLETKKFYISGICLKKYRKEQENKKYPFSKNIFHFFFCLNHSNSQFIFNHSTTIECQKGSLVIFPNEWFYPFENTTPIEGEKVCLEGQIFIK